MSSRDASASSPAQADAERTDGAFDVIVLAGSAGAMAATMAVLRTLGPDFPLPVVVMLHLSPTSDLVSCYQYQSFVPRAVDLGGLRFVARSAAPARLPAQILCRAAAGRQLPAVALRTRRDGQAHRPAARFGGAQLPSSRDRSGLDGHGRRWRHGRTRAATSCWPTS
jgi:hypothetical protein